MSNPINLLTALTFTESPDMFEDRKAQDYPLGTVFTDIGDLAVTVVQVDGARRLLNSHNEVIRGTTWHGAKAAAPDESAVNTTGVFSFEYIDTKEKAGRLFRSKEDGEIYLCVGGLELFDEAEDPVHAIGVTTPSAKLLEDYIHLQWLEHDDVSLTKPMVSENIRARSGC